MQQQQLSSPYGDKLLSATSSAGYATTVTSTLVSGLTVEPSCCCRKSLWSSVLICSPGSCGITSPLLGVGRLPLGWLLVVLDCFSYAVFIFLTYLSGRSESWEVPSQNWVAPFKAAVR